jgi:hypothetical protein
VIENVGSGLTVTVTTAVSLQLFASVPNTTYVEVAAGVAITDAEVEDTRAGPFQLNIGAPPAMSMMLWPLQIVPPVAVTVGVGLTVTIAFAFLEHPLPSVPVTT